MKLANSCPTFS